MPADGEDLYGQDADYLAGSAMSFEDNGDGTVTDPNTGLTWQQVPSSDGFTWQEAVDYADELELAGYDDWRLPSAKELFTISDFGLSWPYLDTDVLHPGQRRGHQGRAVLDQQLLRRHHDRGRFGSCVRRQPRHRPHQGLPSRGPRPRRRQLRAGGPRRRVRHQRPRRQRRRHDHRQRHRPHVGARR